MSDMSKKRKTEQTEQTRAAKYLAIRIIRYGHKDDILLVPSLLPDKHPWKSLLTHVAENYSDGVKRTVKLPYWNDYDFPKKHTDNESSNLVKFLQVLGHYDEGSELYHDFGDLLEYMYKKANTYKGSLNDLDVRCMVVFGSGREK